MKKLLIANRGEIAVRIIRAARELDIRTVAVYSDADQGASHVRLADEKIALGGLLARDSYLNQEKILHAAAVTNCDALHPGYGFFAENAGFAEAAIKAGLCFVGPDPRVIRLMGDKSEARKRAQELKIPVVPGTGAGLSPETLQEFGEQVGYPIILKAVAGGSGRGMRVVRDKKEFFALYGEARAEAEASFKNPEVIAEKFLEHPRHIEVQIFGDRYGKVVHFGERECSVQRRHQKLIEEARAPNLHENVRRRLLEAAVQLGAENNYVNSGTVECLVEGGMGADDPFYFLEMNTRIQVEHPVTEEVTGVDLVKLQLLVAEGECVTEPVFSGHAMEFRIYAEKPEENFAPAMGKLLYLSRPGGPGIRDDGWAEAGTTISPYYDSLITKLIVSGRDRAEVIARAASALREYVVDGPETTLPFHRWILGEESFRRSEVDVYWVGREFRRGISNGSVGPLELPLER